MADALKDLVSGTENPEPSTSTTPKAVTPPADAAASTAPVIPASVPEAPAPPAPAPNDDSSPVAHKKIIKPISDPTAVQPVGLDELLAKEGITNLDDEGHSLAPGAPTVTNPALPSQPAVPSLPTTPHPPGHVISPNNNGVDPNSIAL